MLCAVTRYTGKEKSYEAKAARTPEEILTNLEKQSWEVWKNRDCKFFEGFLSDDHVELSFGGPINKATVVRSVASPNCEVEGLTLCTNNHRQKDELSYIVLEEYKELDLWSAGGYFLATLTSL